LHKEVVLICGDSAAWEFNFDIERYTVFHIADDVWDTSRLESASAGGFRSLEVIIFCGKAYTGVEL